MVANLQKFQGWHEAADPETGKLYKHTWIDGVRRECGPKVPMWDLRGQEDTLILFPRGHLKSSVCTEAHTIQWIINYPDIRIALKSATNDLVEGFNRTILSVFRGNLKFRFLFPEFCPPEKKANDFGNNEEFTVPNRQRKAKEPTVCTMTVGKPRTGFHFDVIKADDVVYPENVRTKEAISAVNEAMGQLTPLRETAKDGSGKAGWLDVIGTRYHHSDYYGLIIRAEEKRKDSGDDPQWKVVCKPAIYFDGKERKALWPEGMPLWKLDKIRNSPEVGSAVFNAQYLMNPIADGHGLATLEQIIWKPKHIADKLRAMMREYVTIDLAGMEGLSKGDTDYTVLNHHGFDQDGRLGILNVIHGRFNIDAVFKHIFELYEKHPRILAFKIEQDAHGRVLMPFLRRESAKRGKFPLFVPIKRDNKTSKEHRIRALQPWFEQKLIWFSEAIPEETKRALADEIQYFPKYAHDDILDTCADAMQSRDGISFDMVPMESVEQRDKGGRCPSPEVMELYKTEPIIDTLTGAL